MLCPITTHSHNWVFLLKFWNAASIIEVTFFPDILFYFVVRTLLIWYAVFGTDWISWVLKLMKLDQIVNEF